MPGKTINRNDDRRRSGPGHWALLLVVVALWGCQPDDEIRHYRVPRPAALSAVESKEGPRRLLAVILPQGERTWFFKLDGPEKLIQEHKEHVDGFIRSVRATGKADQPFTWTLPEGWKAEGPSQFRHATFRFGPKEQPLELAVSSLDGKEAAALLPNVNRWRGQLGLKEMAAIDLPKVATPLKVDGVDAILVDLTGPGRGGMRPPLAVKPPIEPAVPEGPALPLKYKLPEGWKEQPNRSTVRRLVFQVTEGTLAAETTVTPLSGPAGGLLANVNRWREQIGLPPLTEAQLKQDLRELRVGGVPASYIDMLGPQKDGQRRRTLAVMAVHGGQTWFFKLTGPAELLVKQQSAFEAFVESVQFTEGR